MQPENIQPNLFEDETPQPTDRPNSPLVETLLTENEQLRSTLRLRDARDKLNTALASAGARSPELLFEAAKTSLQFTDEGGLSNTTELVDALRLKFPEQFGRYNPSPSIDAGAGTARSAPAVTPESLAQMTPTEIARLDWPTVRQALSNRDR
jgi:hypothetical protein